MTQEEKLEEAKRLYKTANADQKYVLESLFPELKESDKSEDEKIKGAAIEFVRQNNSFNYSLGISKEKVLAWLENQGEQKPTGFDDANAKRMFIKALERVEEQNNKGYKLTDCDKNSWWEDFKTYCGYIEIQKPACSEEDEEMFEHIIAKATLHFSSINYLDEEEINFLKSLKDRVQPQPNKEWSEEDEENFKKAIKVLKVTNFHHIADILQEMKYKLIPREETNNWKPSDEQMNALNYVVNLMASSERPTENDLYYNILKSLRQQLKKLKG